MRIIGDNPEGKAQLDYLLMSIKIPIVVRTSKLMTTGVDCKTCKLIVLITILIMTEFKQIIAGEQDYIPSSVRILHHNGFQECMQIVCRP